MAYSTNTTILTLLPGLPQTLGSAGYTRITEQITSHIVRADSFIIAKISNRYDVSGFNTSGSVPPILTTLSEDIASYYTYRSQFSADNQNANEWVEKFQEAVEVLDEIRKGDMDLVDTAGSLIGERETASLDLVESNNENYQPFFDEDQPVDWDVDSDKLDSIRGNRGY